jgi:hypothetical protein
MINANELRIGNAVLYKPDSRISKIKSVGDTEIIIESGPPIRGAGQYVKSCLPDELDPFELTPGLLERCGFTVRQKYKFFKNYIALNDRGDGNWVIVEFDLIDGHGHMLRNTIKHLHQLQNLYFALTGEELPVKL